MRSFFSFITILFVFALMSCGGNSETADVAVEANDSTFVMSGLSLDLQITIPKSMPGIDEAKIEYNSNFGLLDVSFGDGFVLLISEEEIPMRTVKEELMNDMLFTYEFESENDSVLVYRSILPDGEPHSYQFTKLRKVGGLSLHIQTASMSKFNLQQLNRMADAVNTISPLDQ